MRRKPVRLTSEPEWKLFWEQQRLRRPQECWVRYWR